MIDRDELAARMATAILRAQPIFASTVDVAVACKAIASASYLLAEEMIERRKAGVPCLRDGGWEVVDQKTGLCQRCGRGPDKCPEPPR